MLNKTKKVVSSVIFELCFRYKDIAYTFMMWLSSKNWGTDFKLKSYLVSYSLYPVLS